MFTGILIHVNAPFGDKLIFFGSINNIYKCMLLKWSYFYCVAISVSVLFIWNMYNPYFINGSKISKKSNDMLAFVTCTLFTITKVNKMWIKWSKCAVWAWCIFNRCSKTSLELSLYLSVWYCTCACIYLTEGITVVGEITPYALLSDACSAACVFVCWCLTCFVGNN